MPAKTRNRKILSIDCGPDSRVVCGDMARVLSSPVGADLVIMDSPYNLGMDYDSYTDSRPYKEFMVLLAMWLKTCWFSLNDRGTLWVFVPDEWVSEVDLYCRRVLKMTRRNHVIWAFTFGQAAANKFTRSHCHLLYFTKDHKRFTYNPPAVAVPSARQLVYGDKRAASAGKQPDDVWMILADQMAPYLTPDTDTWMVPRVCGTYKERCPHSPNQLPVELVARIVKACSDPGQLVLDPFLGSGTTGVACAGLYPCRKFLGVDVSEACVRESAKRIAAVPRIASSLNGKGKDNGQQVQGR